MNEFICKVVYLPEGLSDCINHLGIRGYFNHLITVSISPI